MTAHVKMFIRIEGDPGHDAEVESVWALEHSDGYGIDNIPFYAREIAWGDVVKVKRDERGALWFDGLVRASGHSTVRLWFSRPDDVANVRAQLRALQCPSELSDMPRLVAVDIPPDVPYEQVKGFLDQGEADQIFEYEEACLGFRD